MSRRLIPAGLIAAGLLLIVFGFVYDMTFAGLPYPDPTPEMQANWRFQKSVSESLMLAGMVMLLAGVFSMVARWIRIALNR